MLIGFVETKIERHKIFAQETVYASEFPLNFCKILQKKATVHAGAKSAKFDSGDGPVAKEN